MKPLINLLARAVYIVNSDPPEESREAFYEAKDRICRIFGRREADDIQHIVKPCWHCSRWSCDECDEFDACCRCRGTNIYLEFWTRLARYRIGDYCFHRPLERLSKPPANEPVTITGLIKHKHESEFELRRELAMWLIVFFNPMWLIKRLHQLAYRPGTPIKYPLSWFLLRIGWVATLFRRLRKRRQGWSDERFRRRMRRARLKVVEEDDAPF